MTNQELLSRVDHTLLSPTATWEDIRLVLEDAMAFSTASACIPPAYVKRAKEASGGRIPICTVIGFPTGFATTESKVFETLNAVECGADEVDMVISLGRLKEGDFSAVSREIGAVREACRGKILKVIVETCLLTREEKIKMCHIVGESGADYIKTSTGFSTGGATLEDIALFSQHRIPGLKIKAAGGIKTLEDAREFIRLGADRLGTSRVVNLLKELMKQGEKL